MSQTTFSYWLVAPSWSLGAANHGVVSSLCVCWVSHTPSCTLTRLVKSNTVLSLQASNSVFSAVTALGSSSVRRTSWPALLYLPDTPGWSLLGQLCHQSLKTCSFHLEWLPKTQHPSPLLGLSRFLSRCLHLQLVASRDRSDIPHSGNIGSRK